MTAYCIAQIDIHDPTEYQNYLQGFMPVFERHNGRLLVSSAAEVDIIEGHWDLPRCVLLAFPDLQHARAWLDDPDYRTLARHRHRAAQTNLVMVDGVG